MATKKKVGSETTKTSEIKLGVDIVDLAKANGFNCRVDDDGYTLSMQYDLMDMRIYFNKSLDLVRYTTYHTFQLTSEYLTAKNVFYNRLISILNVINDYKNGGGC